MGSSALEHAIKVRKPYTITKQRERWTEEEHSKFLEALKLYGRAWRQIEEHIGTKTAVQIRSHAQKFFSKVARESASHSSGAVKTIEIPPPRPKRKPVHPYPRKLGRSSSKIPVLEQSDWSSIPNLSISDQENRSPTSVLSAVGSDTFGSSASNLMNSCTSPTSSAAESEPVGTLLSEHEDACQSATTSPEDADKSLSPDRSIMEVELGSDDCIPSKEASSMEAQATTLKLFGRTVLVTDTHKLFSSSCGNVEQCHWSVPTVNIESHHGNINMGQQIPVQTSEQNAAHEVLSSGEGTGQWNLWPGGMPPMFYCLPSHGNLSNPADASIVPLPWLWDFYGSVPLPLISPQSMSSEQDQLPSCRDSDDRGMHKEGSLTGSSIVYASEVGVWDSSSSNAVNAGHSKGQDATPALKLRQSETSAFRSLKASSNKPSRGFVPYRRCVAEKVVEHPQMANDNGDSQEVQLCL